MTYYSSNEEMEADFYESEHQLDQLRETLRPAIKKIEGTCYECDKCGGDFKLDYGATAYSCVDCGSDVLDASAHENEIEKELFDADNCILKLWRILEGGGDE